MCNASSQRASINIGDVHADKGSISSRVARRRRPRYFGLLNRTLHLQWPSVWVVKLATLLQQTLTMITARRFKKQIFLSIDVPSSIQSVGMGPALLMQVERGIVATLKEIESV